MGKHPVLAGGGHAHRLTLASIRLFIIKDVIDKRFMKKISI